MVQVKFLAWECPWPAHTGAALRTLGLLKEISKVYTVELVLLSRKPLSDAQKAVLSRYTVDITRISLRDVKLLDKAQILVLMLLKHFPYHCAVLDLSIKGHQNLKERILGFPGIVYASFGHWGTLVLDHPAPNWILDQQNADVDFWRVYALQTTNPLAKMMAWFNWKLAGPHFRRIYQQVGRIVSVCEEDRQLTLSLAPGAQVEVIENGVDCIYYAPERIARNGPPRLLFTGTSAARNVTALRGFVQRVFPLILKKMPEVELMVAGNFSPKAQALFKAYPNMVFTGRVEDIRPCFNQSDIYIAPFEETHGSKLKIAEAMAMGMAIVATQQGIRGFPLVNGESVLVAQSDEQFAEHVLSLLHDPECRDRLGQAARHVALTTVDWRVLGDRLISLIVGSKTSPKMNG